MPRANYLIAIKMLIDSYVHINFQYGSRIISFGGTGKDCMQSPAGCRAAKPVRAAGTPALRHFAVWIARAAGQKIRVNEPEKYLGKYK